MIILVLVIANAYGIKPAEFHAGIKQAQDHRKNFDSKIIDAARSPIEYAVAVAGPPVLVVHGVTGGYDQGITNGRRFIGEGFQIIAPSRFSYQNTPVLKDASPAAQADAFACFLDALNISKIPVSLLSPYPTPQPLTRLPNIALSISLNKFFHIR